MLDVKSVIIGYTTYRLPYADESDWNDDEFRNLVDSIRKYGVLEPIVASAEKSTEIDLWVVAGSHRVMACVELEIEPPVIRMSFPSDEVEAEVASRTNTDRHHMTPEELARRRHERDERIRAMRLAGESVRAIATEVGLSPGVVHRKLASGVPPETPVRGRDGKSYQPTRGPEVPDGTPARLMGVMGSRGLYDAASRACQVAAGKLREVEESPAYQALSDWEQYTVRKLNLTQRVYSADMEARARLVLAMKPEKVCDMCRGVEASQDADLCAACGGKGFLTTDETGRG